MLKRTGFAFGPWFKEYRLAANMTQSDVARETGLHKVTISKVEHGQDVSEETAAMLAQVVGAPMDEAVMRSLKVNVAAMEPANEEERELKRILDCVPVEKRPRFIRTVREMAEMAKA